MSILFKMSSADLNLLFWVRVWRIIEWVSSVRELVFWVLTQLKNSSERTWSFFILSGMCLTLNGVKWVDNKLSLSQSVWIRWLCATFIKSRSWPLGSGSVLLGIGIEFQLLLKFPWNWGSADVGLMDTESSKVENWRNRKILMIHTRPKKLEEISASNVIALFVRRWNWVQSNSRNLNNIKAR